MNPRKVLLQYNGSPHAVPPFNASSSMTKPASDFKSPLDSSMGVTTLSVLFALGLLGFFALYIRRCCTQISCSNPDPDPEPDTNSPNLLASPMCPTMRHVVLCPVITLPLVSYGGEAKECGTCLSELQDGETVRIIPICGHMFHPHCVDTWVLSRMSCPLCHSTNAFATRNVLVILAVPDNQSGNDQEASTTEN